MLVDFFLGGRFGDVFVPLCFVPFRKMDVDSFWVASRMRLPRVVLRVLSPSPCMAVDTLTVPGLMDAVERDSLRWICQATAGHGESGLTARHYHCEQIETEASIEAIDFWLLDKLIRSRVNCQRARMR
jgi:hypothetical protein